nr:MAG TPA: hypothetical protein [Caudoviricetes sp.]
MVILTNIFNSRTSEKATVSKLIIYCIRLFLSFLLLPFRKEITKMN